MCSLFFKWMVIPPSLNAAGLVWSALYRLSLLHHFPEQSSERFDFYSDAHLFPRKALKIAMVTSIDS